MTLNREDGLARLARFRDEIDRIDLELLTLLNRRTSVVEKIGQVKRELDLPVYEPRREDEVYRNITEHNAGPLPAAAVKRVFERIIDEMRTVQRDRMLVDGNAGKASEE